MRQNLIVSVILIGLLFAVPLLLLTPETHKEPQEEREVFPQVEVGELDAVTTLRVKQGDSVTEMSLGEYLQGVVRAEMPASFEMEALKAQTVAARTYTLYKIQTGGNHADADICTDSTCCQAWISREAAAENWGQSAEENEYKIDTAVAETDGMTMLYDGAPILAVFHSSSPGRTRNSEDVWSSALPYLRAVDSMEEGDGIPNYYSRVEFSKEEFRQLFLAEYPQAKLEGGASGWFSNFDMDGLSVKTVEVGGAKVRGTQIRSLLSLRSAAFEVEVEGDTLVFYVTGFGHGVGMSQYGANQMAKAGSTYIEILTHYYTGVSVEPYTLG